ncbi:hypothetical protein KY363_08155 [Candidatus Woesearchaeota archaeon]|nr:hypothetical protein [Candidatus Woesearchaeota archaeon]
MSDTLIYDPSSKDGPMDVVCWGSGSCTTIEAILARQSELEREGNHLFRVAALVTDNTDSRVHEIAGLRGLPVVYVDFMEFVKDFGLDPSNRKDRKDPQMRVEYDQRVLETLVTASGEYAFSIDLNCLAGYMLALHAPITGYFQHRMINSHPADLSVLDAEGHRRYTGDNAVLDAILAGEDKTFTSVHVVRDQVDAGEILVRSAGIDVDMGKVWLVNDIIQEMEPDARRLWLERHYEQKRTKKSLRTFEDAHLRRLLLSRHVAPQHQAMQKIRCDYPAYLFAIEGIAKGEFALRSNDDSTLRSVIYRGEQMPYCGVQLREERRWRNTF